MGEGGAEVKDLIRMQRRCAGTGRREFIANGRAGAGLGAQRNKGQRAFMHGRGADPGADTVDYFRRGQGLHDGDRPLWGDTGWLPDGDPPATGAEVQNKQMARLREEMRRREVEG